jgi:hypothetical protein
MTKDEFDAKLEAAKEKAKMKWEGLKSGTRNVIGWCIDHPVETAAGLTALGTATAGITKLANKVDHKLEVKREDYRRKTEKYDPVTGSWLKLKRPMTSAEQIELAERRQGGESTTVILASMGILRR